MVNVKKLCAIIAALTLVGCVAPRRAEAQFLGYVGLQSNQTQVLNASTTTGRTPVNANIGGATHAFTYCTTAGVTALQFVIEETPDNVAGHWTQVGQPYGLPITINGNPCNVVVFGGYYSNLAVNVLTLTGAGSLSVWYSSVAGPTSAFPPAFNSRGAFSPVQCDKFTNLTAVAASTTAQVIAGNTTQTIYVCGFTISFSGVPSSAGFVTLEYGSGAGTCNAPTVEWTAAIATAGSPQLFSVAPQNSVLLAPAAGTANNVCLVTGAITVTTTISLSYAQF